MPPGYRAQVVVAWGDPLFPGLSPFNLDQLTPAAQERRFGFNADFVMFLPLDGPDDGLLWVNHEYLVDRSHLGLQPANYRDDAYSAEWPGRGRSAATNLGRSDRRLRVRHAQQLWWRRGSPIRSAYALFALRSLSSISHV